MGRDGWVSPSLPPQLRPGFASLSLSRWATCPCPALPWQTPPRRPSSVSRSCWTARPLVQTPAFSCRRCRNDDFPLPGFSRLTDTRPILVEATICACHNPPRPTLTSSPRLPQNQSWDIFGSIPAAVAPRLSPPSSPPSSVFFLHSHEPAGCTCLCRRQLATNRVCVRACSSASSFLLRPSPLVSINTPSEPDVCVPARLFLLLDSRCPILPT